MGEGGPVREDKPNRRNTRVDRRVYGRVEGDGRMSLLLGRSVKRLEREVRGWMGALWRK